MKKRMLPEWYHLLRSVHYLGYHTRTAMSYDYDEALDFTLVTSNAKEVGEVQSLLKEGGKVEAAIWVIEGVQPAERGGRTQYYLREVFHPRTIEAAEAEHSPGARKKYDYVLDGLDAGIAFEEALPLNDEPWFPAFLEDNGRFAFGLRLLRDQAVKEEFLRLARPFFEE